MAESDVLAAIERQEWLQPIGDTLRTAIQAALQGGNGSTRVEDFLHGTWLGHPLHPVLTDVPVGAWTTALALDLAEMSGSRACGEAADIAVALGLAGAAGAAVTGLTDWKYTTDRPARVGVAHALSNVTATLLYSLSLACRRSGNRRAGRVLSTLGYAAISAGAWLGGHLVYGEHVGVDRSTDETPPQDWVAVLPADQLQEDKLTRVEANGAPVLLVKRGQWISAIGEKCAHMGGPLSEGHMQDSCVTCPWHGSTFSLDDGSVVTSPSVFPEPVYETRIRDGHIEVRAVKV